jgi:photosystem I subunit PsaO
MGWLKNSMTDDGWLKSAVIDLLILLPSNLLNRFTRVVGTRVVGGRVPRAARRTSVRVAASANGYQWLNKEPLALMAGFAGWFLPSNIPVSAFGGKSLFGLFMESISENLAHFPTGPALDDKFWLYMITWHVGLFLTLTLGQIGIQGRKQGYFNWAWTLNLLIALRMCFRKLQERSRFFFILHLANIFEQES